MAEVTALLNELAAYIGAQLNLNFADVPQGEQRELYVHRLDREAADATASVLRLSGGPASEYMPTVALTIQCRTQAASEQAALERAWAIHDVFITTSGLPVRGLQLTNWLLLKIDAVQKPFALGPLAGGGADVSFNWIIEAVEAAA